ncbi:hypothetical protein SALBM135S_08592 [Streptomyces alboniger]
MASLGGPVGDTPEDPVRPSPGAADQTGVGAHRLAGGGAGPGPRPEPRSMPVPVPVPVPVLGKGPGAAVEVSGATRSTANVRAVAVAATAARWGVLRGITTESLASGYRPGARTLRSRPDRRGIPVGRAHATPTGRARDRVWRPRVPLTPPTRTTIPRTGRGTEAGGAGPWHPPHRPGPDLDPNTAYEPQRDCEPEAKPGLADFREALALAASPVRPTWGTAGPATAADQSEHKAGRAWEQGANVQGLGHLADDLIRPAARHGPARQPARLARRFGIMHPNLNRRIWMANRPDTGANVDRGANPHTNPSTSASCGWHRKETRRWQGPGSAGPAAAVGGGDVGGRSCGGVSRGGRSDLSLVSA